MNEFLVFFKQFGVVLAEEVPHALPDGDSFFNKIIPNLWAFLIQLAALIIMIIVFIWVGYKPVKKIIKDRQDHIEKEINDAEQMNIESSEKLKEAKENLSSSKKLAMQIVDDAKEDALKEKEKIVTQTQLEVKALRKKATDDIELEKEKAKDDIRREIITVALDASKEVLKREINETDNSKLVDEFINEIEGE